MPPHHHHDDCGHEHQEHSQVGNEPNPQDNLYKYIDRENVIALNASRPGYDVIKPWHNRQDESVCIESDADDQLILRIPFMGSVRLRGLLLKSGPVEHTPSKVLLFANEMNLDFSDVTNRSPTQEFNVAQARGVGEYSLRTAKFSNLSSISLYFPSSQGADSTRVYYVGFLGHWSERKEEPVITVYEAQPNISDHDKIQGTEGNLNIPQL
ncbi:hypothetical protein AMATHDRAFT_188451 [Amanita thiersii Skay4041]|uniref:PITH domain-containing protein n=1 Tax=Amanita thiersii Skay4041 TaxID=703135 RepID=A0A2A9NYU0_9AGAR|nr:hypothetical protein AMATHDRAFT_188451 [Amanita thiersii Skay4041]